MQMALLSPILTPPLLQLTKYFHAKNWKGVILIAIEVLLGVLGFKKSYVICRVGQAKSYVCLQGGWVGQKKAQNMLT